MKKYCGILIDSSCTYDEKFIKENNIEVIPLSFSDKDNHVYDDDNKQITAEDMLNRLDRHETFKTSATPIGKLMVKVETMLEEYEHVIFLPIAMGLSSQYAQSLIIQQDYPDKFFIVKSLSAAIANEFVLTEIVNLVKQKQDVKLIVEKAQQMYDYILTYFSCEELSGMKSGGRVTRAIVKTIDFLKLKPIIQLDYKNQYAGMGKNYKNIATKIIKAIFKSFSTPLKKENIKRVGIYLGGYDEEKKNYLTNIFSEAFNFVKEKIIFRMIPTIVLVHTHRGCYGITIETDIKHKERKHQDN